MDAEADVVVIGGGQAGLATSYWLRRAGIGHVVLDDADGPGGSCRGGPVRGRSPRGSTWPTT